MNATRIDTRQWRAFYASYTDADRDEERRGKLIASTRWYPSRQQALDMLMRHRGVGKFEHTTTEFEARLDGYVTTWVREPR